MTWDLRLEEFPPEELQLKCPTTFMIEQYNDIYFVRLENPKHIETEFAHSPRMHAYMLLHMWHY